MLTDKNIFKNKVIECRTYVCERRIIKQGYQTEVNFEGTGVKKGTWSQQQVIIIMKSRTFIFEKRTFMLKKGLCPFENYLGRGGGRGSIAPSISRPWRASHKNTSTSNLVKKKKN